MLHDDTKSHCSPRDTSISLKGMNESVVFFLIIEKKDHKVIPGTQTPHILLPSPREVNHILWLVFYCSTKMLGGENAGNSDMNSQPDLWQFGHLAAVRGQLGLDRGYNETQPKRSKDLQQGSWDVTHFSPGSRSEPLVGVGESKGQDSRGLRHKQSQFPPAQLEEKGMWGMGKLGRN